MILINAIDLRFLFSSLAQLCATGRMRYFQSKCNKLSMQLKINNQL